jgi:tRNA synthetase class I (W and Y)
VTGIIAGNVTVPAADTRAPEPVGTPRGRVLTGFRPTGALHVGHWAGNVSNAVRLQDEGYDCYYFVADWHMLTTHYDRTAELPALVEEIVLDLLACGIDPARSVFYLQSDLPEVAEMAPPRDDHAARMARARADVQGATP